MVNKTIYRIPEPRYREALDELVDLLDLAPLLDRQVRVLSLGERMRCELAGALLHHPRVLFLDEPTLGLDVTAQAALRGFLVTTQPPRGDGVADQPLHGRCDRPGAAGDRYRPG